MLYKVCIEKDHWAQTDTGTITFVNEEREMGTIWCLCNLTEYHSNYQVSRCFQVSFH